MTLEHTALAKKFYKSKAWKKTRQAYFNSKFGICERCEETGDIVHHKVYLDINNINDPDVILNWENLELLCIFHHNSEHFRKHEAIEEGYYFDEDGQLRYREE